VGAIQKLPVGDDGIWGRSSETKFACYTQTPVGDTPTWMHHCVTHSCRTYCR